MEVVKTTGNRALDEEINRILARVKTLNEQVAELGAGVKINSANIAAIAGSIPGPSPPTPTPSPVVPFVYLTNGDPVNPSFVFNDGVQIISEG